MTPIHARRRIFSRTVSLSALAGLPAAAGAQTFLEPEAVALHVLAGEAAGHQFGWAVSPIGDLDGDGVMELISPAPGYGGNLGRIYVNSGRTGQLFNHLLLTGTVPGGRFGHAIADAGDVDLDTLPDLVQGSPAPATSAGRVSLFSGATGAHLRTVEGQAAGDGFGYAVAGVGDLNGDGRAEVLVGAPGHDSAGPGAGRVYILSGADGSILRFHDGDTTGGRMGSGVTGIGDADGDSVPDYAAAASLAGPAGRGRAYLFSGATGQQLLPPLEPDPAAGAFGDFFIGGPGDVNRDGTPDVYVGDYAAGRAYVFSGRDGSRMHTFIQGQGLGCGRGAGDVNGDGHADLAVGAYVSSAGGPGAGRVYIFSGADGSVLRTITSTRAGENFGYDAIGVGDLDGDGKIDFFVGAATGDRTYSIAGIHSVCYANCDSSTAEPVLNVNDFICFINKFAAGAPAANCDGSTAAPVLNVNDFVCYQTRYAQGCP